MIHPTIQSTSLLSTFLTTYTRKLTDTSSRLARTFPLKPFPIHFTVSILPPSQQSAYTPVDSSGQRPPLRSSTQKATQSPPFPPQPITSLQTKPNHHVLCSRNSSFILRNTESRPPLRFPRAMEQRRQRHLVFETEEKYGGGE